MTPARAGTTMVGIISNTAQADDPRSRGDDNNDRTDQMFAYRMTPARAGTTSTPDRGAGRRRRMTPARAGTTASPAVGDRSPPDDPRSRGDDAFSAAAHVSGADDPRSRGDDIDVVFVSCSTLSDDPRSRGDDMLRRSEGSDAKRMTPARAGTTTRADRVEDIPHG